MAPNLQTEIIEFLAKERGVKAYEVTPDQSLNFDLGMDGDDAVEFFEAFGEKFKVDLSTLGEEWDRYFGPEGWSLFGMWEVLTLFRTKQRHPMVPLPVSRLISSAQTGKWMPLEEIS